MVLESACRLFGERGYDNASLEDIAGDCGLTPRPVYHYFGNKKALFQATTEAMESKILDVLSKQSNHDIFAQWDAFLELCSDPGFRRVVLQDSPNVLGRDRWNNSVVNMQAQEGLNFKPQQGETVSTETQRLLGRMMAAAMMEAALSIAEAEDISKATKEAQVAFKMLVAPFLKNS